MVACAKTLGKEIKECTRDKGCICRADEAMLTSCGWFQRGNGEWSHMKDGLRHRALSVAVQINNDIMDKGRAIENYMAEKYPDVI